MTMPIDPSLVPVALSLEIPDIVRDIGAVAGFASFIGLAVLSALYFSQARDVKRLREWAGRAPEREPLERAAVQARAQAAALAAQQRQQQAQQAQQGGQPQPAGPRPASAAGATATAPQAPRRIPSTPAGNGAPPAAPPVGARPSAVGQRTQILPPGAVRPPWYRRLVPDLRTALMALAAVLVLGAAVAFAVIQVGGDDGAESGAPAQQARGGDERASEPPAEPPSPSEITVSVLNGTTVTGLASQYRDALEEAGYDVGNAANFSDQAKAESVVLYAKGERPAARVVARDLDINQIEPVDPESQQLGGNASVIVVLGADKTP